jgi:hypothetical protein
MLIAAFPAQDKSNRSLHKRRCYLPVVTTNDWANAAVGVRPVSLLRFELGHRGRGNYSMLMVLLVAVALRFPSIQVGEN